ncbi:MAG: hypothetical protein K1X82_13390 [Bacteroidia bacterium]|nr:hypothetical protein [Bacteroidia bacterium]
MSGIRIFTLLTLLGSSLVGSSQLVQPKEDKELASNQIINLKEGALLIRLKKNSLKVEALRKYGREQEAKEEERRMELENASTIRAIKTSYTFSRYYFFYSENSDLLRARKWDGIVLDSTLMPVNLPKNLFYLVGEFGETREMNIDAFVVLDSQYIQMEKPFPFMVKRINNLVANRKKEDIIRILNDKFFEFYEKGKEYLEERKLKAKK